MIFKKKQTLAMAAIVIGVIFVIFANYGIHKVQKVKGSVDQFTDFFSNSKGIWDPLIEFFGGEVNERASAYDGILMILMIAGIAMIVSGVWGVFHYRKKLK